MCVQDTYSTRPKKVSVSNSSYSVLLQYKFTLLRILRIIAWAIERSAQRRLARQKEEELRLATRYSDSGDMGLQKRW